MCICCYSVVSSLTGGRATEVKLEDDYRDRATSIDDHMKILRRGDVFKKYNKMWSAHRRYVWWEEEENCIKWRPMGNKKKATEKGISISEITEVKTDKSGKAGSGE